MRLPDTLCNNIINVTPTPHTQCTVVQYANGGLSFLNTDIHCNYIIMHKRAYKGINI